MHFALTCWYIEELSVILSASIFNFILERRFSKNDKNFISVEVEAVCRLKILQIEICRCICKYLRYICSIMNCYESERHIELYRNKLHIK